MDHLEQTRRNISLRLFVLLVLDNVIVLGIVFGLRQVKGLDSNEGLAISLVIGLILSLFISRGISRFATIPLRAVWQLIMHLSPSNQGTPAPSTKELKLGQELVASLTAQVYELVSVSSKASAENKIQANDLHHNFIAQNLPLPLVVIDKDQNIKFVNEAASQYVGIASEDMISKNVYMVLDMSFPSEDTFDTWLKQATAKKATAVASWERVRLNVRDSHPVRLFDLAAYYNRDNSEGNETMIVLFDHTTAYSQDEQAVSFMALSVHELRTPLTLLRGYIEVFEDELSQVLSEEQKGFMQKMRSQAEQLTYYVNNILNVARVDSDQLELNLHSEDWVTTLKGAVDAISLRAKVRGISIDCKFEANLPPVAVDKISIHEVVINLIDNAIKYSGNGKVIDVATYMNKEGMVETTVHDSGNGISSSIISNLFTKFYRDHRNRAQVGGTGLGLYLSKAIVTAHKGSIWVRSQEGQGSTFGFTLLPYDKLAESLKNKSSDSIESSAHGWIKNHSLYRR